ncbi:ABC transporter permease [Paenibacillus baekrokdamisoli]|uniref:ABC transporter permease n=2 Tax=Paenibacillus baekrokdamisoli TaxID=1712516 RepID=A0A3G9JQC6_9BACL|nr:putative aldouronate transport system permease protein [Paenibacillus baekrokdamisoli]BBH25024.1 ABC transporter permease [Paenibacillus baekrokdamisoli]BBH25042.1 ABC transporter permease [Paenibacillus baekrokdamisoli]
MNTIQKRKQIWLHLPMIALSAACVLPFLLLAISSISDEGSIIRQGYTFFPEKFGLGAYRYLWDHSEQLVRAYGITIFITVVGTASSLIITAMLAYPMARQGVPLRNLVAFLVFFTLLFNGGLTPTYLIYVQYIDIKNTVLALIVPGLLMNGFNVLLMRTFFMTTIPPALIEAAQIDGAGEFKIFCRIILPLSMPIVATIGLIQTIIYWNDWFNGMIYVTDSRLFSVQNILNRMLTDIQFLTESKFSAQFGEAGANLPSTTVKMAIAIIGVLPIMVLYPFFQKYLIKGITVGAVKG